MLKKLFLAMLILSTCSTVFAQEKTEPTRLSAITEMNLPSGAGRVLPSSVPAEISSGFEQIIKAGKGKIIGGEREVLAWTGSSYKKGSVANLVKQIENNLRMHGWEYEAGAEEKGITFFSALRERPSKRAVLGFFVVDNSGLLLVWTEVLATDSASQNKPENKIETQLKYSVN